MWTTNSMMIIICSLIKNNPDDLDIVSFEKDTLVEPLHCCPSISITNDELESLSDEEKEDLEYRTKDVIRKYQFDYDKTTCMIPKFPETVSEKVVESISFAPGEGKIPSNILKEEEWDIKSFPCLHPSGKNGLHQKREVKGRLPNSF